MTRIATASSWAKGAGVVVLEEYEHAKARGAKIYAEVIGYGLSGDAYHVTAPHPEGDRARSDRCRWRCARSGWSLSDIDYINAHGTSTPLGDELELGAVRRLFGDAIKTVSMSRPSRRSAICSAAPARSNRSSASSRCATRSCPPTLNLDNPSESCEGVDLVPQRRQGAQGEGGAEQQLRLRRHQCQPRDAGETRAAVLARMQKAMTDYLAQRMGKRRKPGIAVARRPAQALARSPRSSRKETGKPEERRMVAAVYSNRLRVRTCRCRPIRRSSIRSPGASRSVGASSSPELRAKNASTTPMR
jgi:hypothetical protein